MTSLVYSNKSAGKLSENWMVTGTFFTRYTLTHLTSLSAPFAGAVTSAAIGLTSLITDLKKEQITMDEFVTQGQVLCFEAGIAATGGAIGQMLIPVPVLGAVIGTVTANFVWGFAKDKLGEREIELTNILNNYLDSVLVNVEEAYHEILSKIRDKYAHYNSLIDAAFDVNTNSTVLANASVVLAEKIGVNNHKILKNDTDLENYFLG
jgi:hypothetical protein